MNIGEVVFKLRRALDRKRIVKSLLFSLEGSSHSSTRIIRGDLSVVDTFGDTIEKTITMEIPKEIGIQILREELEALEKVIEKIQPVVDAADTMAKKILGD